MSEAAVLDAPGEDVRSRRASLKITPNSWNPDDRTIEVIGATGTPVLERGPKGPYYEVLTFGPDSIDDTRLDGMAALNSHRSGDLRDHLGAVVSHTRAADHLGLKIRLTERPDAAGIVGDIISGSIQWVSITYKPLARKARAAINGTPAMDVTRWEPLEISFVSVPADPAARVRSTEPDAELRAIVRESVRAAIVSITETGAAQQERNMTDAVVDAGEKKPVEKEEKIERKADPVVIDAAAYQRVAKICGLSSDDALTAISRAQKGEETFEAWSNRMYDARAKLADETAVSTVHITRDAAETMTRGLEQALCFRVGTVKEADLKEGRDYAGMSLIEMGRTYLDGMGVKTQRMTAEQIASALLTGAGAINRSSGPGYHGTSDFTNILANTANKTLRAAYDSVPQTFRQWARGITLPDFKPVSITALSEAPDLLEINEHGEFTYGTMSDEAETIQLKEYGRIFAITRKALINDDTGAFTRMPQMYGVAAAEKESDIVYNVLLDNDDMSDGNALFDATNHGNKGTTGVPSDTTLTEAFQDMGSQVGISGKAITVRPKFLIVGTALEQTAKKLLATVAPTAQSDVNIWSNSLELIVERRVSASKWFIIADPATIDTVVYAHLAGQQGVYTERREGFNVSGTEFKARLDFGAAAGDWRGMYYNQGA